MGIKIEVRQDKSLFQMCRKYTSQPKRQSVLSRLSRGLTVVLPSPRVSGEASSELLEADM